MAQSRTPSPTSLQSEDAPQEEDDDGRLLDGFLLLAAGGASTPEDVVSVNLSSLEIVDVAEEDLAFFEHLDRVDVSDNRLGSEHVLRQFGRLPRVASLSLACNSISSLRVPPGQLRRLQSLDLSYNGLHGEVMSQLAKLPSLVTLNLSSNCISLVPPEGDICGLQALEHLNLDNNDLVQFVQWRALDALPRLKKLSLASNRVKRLKDDLPDAAGEEPSYFAALEELDLSANEIVSIQKLPVVQCFRRLQILRLSGNPCTKGPGAEAQVVPGVNVHAAPTKQWYLCGSGCFKKRAKVTEPKLKIAREKMHRVRSLPQIRGSRDRSLLPQLCVYDQEANQLLISMRSMPGLADGHVAAKTALDRPVPALVPPPEAGDSITLADDISDDELDKIFRERREIIERSFNAPVDEPTNFIKSTPFAVSASEKANQLLGRINGTEEPASAEPASPPSPLLAPGAGGAAGGSGRRTPPSTLFSLTSLGDEAADLVRAAQARGTVGGSILAHRGRQADAPADTAPSPGTTKLPPIDAASRGPSRSSSVAGDAQGAGRVAPPVADIGVREAMRALRAAALSEYAVAM